MVKKAVRPERFKFEDGKLYEHLSHGKYTQVWWGENKKLAIKGYQKKLKNDYTYNNPL